MIHTVYRSRPMLDLFLCWFLFGKERMAFYQRLPPHSFLPGLLAIIIILLSDPSFAWINLVKIARFRVSNKFWMNPVKNWRVKFDTSPKKISFLAGCPAVISFALFSTLHT